MKTIELLRLACVLVHIVALAVALGAVLREDVRLLTAKRIDQVALHETHVLVLIGLAALWVSGAIIVWIDTGWQLVQILERPKLMTKLTTVMLLTLNGVLIDRVALPMMPRPQRRPALAALFLATVGAISTTSWLFAAFLGVAKPVAAVLGLSGLIALYAVALVGAIAFAALFIQPRVMKLLIHAPDLPRGARVPRIRAVA